MHRFLYRQLVAIAVFAHGTAVSADPANTLQNLRNLPPLLLDSPSVCKAIANLLTQLKSQQPSLKQLSELEQSLTDESADLSSLRASTQELLSRLDAEATAKTSNSISSETRRELEGLKVMFMRGLNLLDRIDKVEKNPQQRPEPQPPTTEQQTGQQQTGQQQTGQQQTGQQQTGQQQTGQQQTGQQQTGQQQTGQQQTGQQQTGQQQTGQQQTGQQQTGQQQTGQQQTGQQQTGQQQTGQQQTGQQQTGQQQTGQQQTGQQQTGQQQTGQQQSGQQQSGQQQSGQQQSGQQQSGQQQSGQQQSGQQQSGQQQSGQQQSGQQQSGQQQSGQQQSGQQQSGQQQSGQQQSGQQQSGQQQSGQQQSGQQQSGQQQTGQQQSGQQQSGQQQSGQQQSGQQQSGSQQPSGSPSQLAENFENRAPQESSANERGERQEDIGQPVERSAPNSQSGPGAGKGTSSTFNSIQSLNDAIKKRSPSTTKVDEPPSKAQHPVDPSRPQTAPPGAEDSSALRALKDIATDRNYKPTEKLPETWQPEQVPRMLKSLLNSVWAETMRQYFRQDELLADMLTFSSVCRTLYGTFPKTDFLAQYSLRAQRLHDFVEAVQVPPYRELESLGLSLIAQANASERDAKLKATFTTFGHLLGEINQVTSLTVHEARVRDQSKHLNAKLEANEASPTEKEIGETVKRQMMGPLSRKALSSLYPAPDNSVDSLNWTKLVHGLQNGQIDDLLLIGRMRPYMKLLLKSIRKPLVQRKYAGSRVPINEAEPLLDIASDLDNLPHFQNDGAPMDQMVDRFLYGDMLERVFHDEVKVKSTKEQIPKKVSTVLYDVSGSMDINGRYLLRNAAMLAYLDHCYNEMVQGKADHVVYAVPFDGHPHSPERIAGIKGFQEAFARFRNLPPGSGSSTSITQAWEFGYSMIAQHRAEGGECTHGNILLITDGADTINVERVKKAREAIGADVEIASNAITIQEGNSDMERIIKENASGEALGKAAYHFIDPERSTALQDLRSYTDLLADVARADNRSGNRAITMSEIIQFKDDLLAMGFRKGMDDPFIAALTHETLSSFKPNGVPERARVLDEAFAVFLSTVKGPISERWKTDTRLKIFSGFLDEVARELKVTPKEILYQTPTPIYEQVRQWLMAKGSL